MESTHFTDESQHDPGIPILQLIMYILALGVALAIAIPIVLARAASQYDAIAQADLLRLANAQKTYFEANRCYADSLSTLAFVPADSVHITIGGTGLATGSGWSATARHASTPDRKCIVGFGADTLVGGLRSTPPGTVVCK
jgi:hypothetical protein